MHHIHTQQSGYTLFETIIVVGIFTMVSLTIGQTILFLYKTNANSIEQAFALMSARKGVESMTRDIREATFGSEGSYPINSIDPYEFSFYSNIDADTTVERIRYYVQNASLYRGVIEATGTPLVYSTSSEIVSIVSEDVRNISQGVEPFNYFDTGGVEVTNMNNVLDVRFVNVNLIVNINPARLPEEFMLRSSATLRNLKDNL